MERRRDKEMKRQTGRETDNDSKGVKQTVGERKIGAEKERAVI